MQAPSLYGFSYTNCEIAMKTMAITTKPMMTLRRTFFAFSSSRLL